MTTANTDTERMKRAREAFEADARAYGFDLTRSTCAAPEPWSEYADSDTGHRWAGWLAAVDASNAATLPALPKARVLASGMIAGKAIDLRGWHTEDIEIWERQHGLKFGS